MSEVEHLAAAGLRAQIFSHPKLSKPMLKAAADFLQNKGCDPDLFRGAREKGLPDSQTSDSGEAM